MGTEGGADRNNHTRARKCTKYFTIFPFLVCNNSTAVVVNVHVNETANALSFGAETYISFSNGAFICMFMSSRFLPQKQKKTKKKQKSKNQTKKQKKKKKDFLTNLLALSFFY